MIIRKHYIVHGYVQGVGFRYRTYYAAQKLSLTGWVRNLYDGTVEIEAQGEEEMVRDLIPSVVRGNSLFSFLDIQKVDAKEIPLDEEERSFQIRD